MRSLQLTLSPSHCVLSSSERFFFLLVFPLASETFVTGSPLFPREGETSLGSFLLVRGAILLDPSPPASSVRFGALCSVGIISNSWLSWRAGGCGSTVKFGGRQSLNVNGLAWMYWGRPMRLALWKSDLLLMMRCLWTCKKPSFSVGFATKT